MKKILGWVFLGLLTVIFVGYFFTFPWKDRVEYFQKTGGGIAGLADTALDTLRASVDITNDHILGHDLFVQLYGGVQRVVGVDAVADTWSVNSIFRLKNGSVTFLLLAPKPFNDEELSAIRQLGDAADETGAQKLYVVIPQKACRREEPFAARGVYDGSEDIDAYRKDVFSALGYPVLDLHEAMHDERLDHMQLYYRTDHHWTFRAGLWAAGEIAKTLSLDNADLYTEDQYDIESHPRYFLGSEGKRVGTLYSGVDDLDIPIPRFDTAYDLEIAERDIRKTGSFADTMLFREEMKLDYFHAAPYRVLLKGDHALVTIRNRNLPDGKRVVMIKDSFADCMAPYLAASCRELVLLDMRYFKQSVADYLRDEPADVLLIAQSARTANSDFRYLRTENAAADDEPLLDD